MPTVANTVPAPAAKLPSGSATQSASKVPTASAGQPVVPERNWWVRM